MAGTADAQHRAVKTEWWCARVVVALVDKPAYSAHDFLFDFNRNHASIVYRFRDIVGYLWKVADFDPPHLYLAPRRE